jgi:hypothetical protein
VCFLREVFVAIATVRFRLPAQARQREGAEGR